MRTAQRDLFVDPAGSIAAAYVKSQHLHPLVYRKRIDRIESAQPGDLVAIYTANGELGGYGVYNPRSEIILRTLWYGPDLPTVEDWNARFQRAVALRHDILNIPNVTDAYRVVHAEADHLSGLVIDRLGDVLSAEAFSLGMFQRGQAILDQLQPLCGTRHTLLRTSPQFESQEGCAPADVKSADFPDSTIVQEYGTRFRVRFADAHKTGYFCDQRENRRRLALYCEGKSVLDLCCYTGGFSVQAAKLGRAEQVTGVDLDHHPLAVAKENANLNQVRARFVQADAFSYMREMQNNGRQFDVVVLDPPKLIRSRGEYEEGTRKHFALNRLALQLVRPGGLLLSCSCAGLLPESEFVNLLVAAARRAEGGVGSRQGREIRFLDRTGAGPDHPVLGNCLETEYLKAAWMLVD